MRIIIKVLSVETNCVDVNDEVRKISFFISSLGQEPYQVLRDLCHPVLPFHYQTYDHLRKIGAL